MDRRYKKKCDTCGCMKPRTMTYKGLCICEDCLEDDINKKDKEYPFDIFNLSTGNSNQAETELYCSIPQYMLNADDKKTIEKHHNDMRRKHGYTPKQKRTTHE